MSVSPFKGVRKQEHFEELHGKIQIQLQIPITPQSL